MGVSIVAKRKEETWYDTEAARQARIDLAAAYRLAVRFGFHEAIDNHFSLLLPGRDDLMLLNPYPLHWSEITAGNLLLTDFQGNRLEGAHEVEPTALHIHAPLHRANPEDFRCLLHTHMPYATAVACRQGGRLEMVHQTSTRFDDDVAYLEDYNGLVLDRTEGGRIARVMAGKNVLFMANHGVITAGRTVAEAFDRLVLPGTGLPGTGARGCGRTPAQAPVPGNHRLPARATRGRRESGGGKPFLCPETHPRPRRA